ncbi:MAG TPA: CPBP family glutamic-type intramembrane protease, partial [Anaerolinea sp.]|nr:CPBP family glutamic-type intramembrane protease [Anaerolinea sp.]
IFIVIAVVAIFLTRTQLAARYDVPRLFDIFDLITVAGSLIVLATGFRRLHGWDWLAGLLLGGVVGVEMLFTTLFSPYPFLGILDSPPSHAILRGLFTFLSALGGLAILRQGGPVQLHIANRDGRNSIVGVLTGLAVGLPLAILNVFALQITQGHPVDWQKPLPALLDALQPGILEEVIYRFALWGLLWLVLRASLAEKAVWPAGVLAMLIHNYAHFDDLFLQSPFTAIGMGAVLAIVWGVPPLILARRRGLEASIAFHWLQDALRFLTGF